VVKQTIHKKPRLQTRGFSLIEAALILGIVGLVIGGIWLAARTVHENKKIADVTEAILYASRQGRSLLPLHAIQAAAPTGEAGLTGLAVSARLFPAQMISGTSLVDP
jgi:hypothetical protein